jgi:hypothetical protein
MSRAEWDRLTRNEEDSPDGPIEIEIQNTPLGLVARKTKVVGSFVRQGNDERTLIVVLREDPKDEPYVINVDQYVVWDNVFTQIDYEGTVKASDTDDDAALRSMIDDYVFIVPKEKDSGHHLTEIPAIYKAVLERKKNAS